MSAHFITTKVAVEVCLRCQRPVLTGWTEGLRARVDLTPISRAGEVAAIIANRSTYVLHNKELTYRTDYRIRGNSISGPLLISHLCRDPVPHEYRAPVQPAAPITISQPERIPY